ncbi:hypothetical protein GMDG_02217 [Pseudogymnoascus destructans 20631-21]|uniref:Uncharacterized protein n=1 Tax=Pseudogymnoascus destructans (strain ATCC MYA-4855 / 20631-21) TaxID=658429 RepID=L8G1U6_PSED2|nr:hypothetical protein GMDG_02217 [Pseudogymnoascus destructans 20631-21]
MAAPSKNRASSPYTANNPHRSHPSQYHPAYTSQYHGSAPTSAPTTSPFAPSPHGRGTYISPSPHGIPLFNAELHAHQLSLQERDLSYQHTSSPSSSEETYGDFSPIYATAPPSSALTMPSSQTPQHHFTRPCHKPPRQTWETGNPFTPTTFAPYHEDGTPVAYFTTTSPITTSTPAAIHQGQENGYHYIGTPSTPPSPLHPHISPLDLTTPTTEACARYRNAQDTPLTPFFFQATSPAVTAPRSEAGSEFSGVLVGEVGNKEASEVVHRLMADQKGTSRFPASLAGWNGFENPEEEKSGQGGSEELISPCTTTHTFPAQETPQYAETPSPLAPAYTSPLTSPRVRRTYQNSNAYRHFVPPPGPLSPLPLAPRLPLPEPRYSEDYSINADDVHVARARQLLEEHMKNRWGSVLSANQALQFITGTDAGSSRAPLETAAAALVHIKNRVPQQRPILPGFGTPMQSMQRMQAERAGRARSLRAIYDEYFSRPDARAVELCSLSIHAVSGSFGNSNRSSGSSSSGTPNCQPAKLKNELLAHFTASEGGAAIQFVEIDIPNPTGSYNRHPFERWAFFVIAVPMVCGPGGVDKGFVGSWERGRCVGGWEGVSEEGFCVWSWGRGKDGDLG